LPEKTDKKALILLLGGTGSRFKGPLPKQFFLVKNLKQKEEKLLFVLTLENILNSITFHAVFLVIHPSYLQHKKIIKNINKIKDKFSNCNFYLIPGGRSRSDSMTNGFKVLREKENNILKIAVHDANRPYLSKDFLQRIEKNLNKLSEKKPAFVPVIPSVDSLCLVKKNEIKNYVNRDEIFQIQTPQLLWVPAVEKTLQKKDKFTDEGSRLLNFGFKVFTFEGDFKNKKITYKEDLL